VPLIFSAVHRLEAEPMLSDLARGFAAELADPTWLLGSQWRVGEHLGEDASSPVRVDYRCRLTPIDPLDGDPNQDPRTTPAEAIVESEPGDFWTAGRRVLAGRQVAEAATAAGTPVPTDDPTLRLTHLPSPYEALDGTGFDGRTLWNERVRLGLDPTWFGEFRPPEPAPRDLWDSAEFAYNANFSAGSVTLPLSRHDGGDLDWYSVDAEGQLPAVGQVRPETVVPTRVRYPGAPLPRWFQIEDSKVDVGGYPPDRGHLATVLLIDLIVNQSDDWFGFPVEALAGHVATIEEAVVTDSFGDTWTLEPPADGWTLFATAGLSPRSLVVWATTATPLVGPPLDEVTLGIDEDANLAFAVERRLRGRDITTEEDPLPEPPARLDVAERPGFAYRPSTRIPRFWHPYIIQSVNGRRRFVQGRAADLSGPAADLLPAASSDLLIDPNSGGRHPIHQIEPAVIPPYGLKLERRSMLARRTDASPVLWTQRRRLPLLTPPALRLRFDTLEPVPAKG
jgi:hypothetical protein